MTDRARLVLFVPAPEGGWPDTLVATLSDALAIGRVDAVVLACPALDDRSLVKALKPVVGVIQSHGAAALLQDQPDIVARSGADGVHLTDPASVGAALAALKPHDRIVGVGGLRARHDAMEVAEEGCDYVLFGEPREDGSAPPASAVLERVQWWAELFQTPCIGFVTALDDVRSMAETGCEFVGLGAAVFGHSDGAAAAVAMAAAAIDSATVPQR